MVQDDLLGFKRSFHQLKQEVLANPKNFLDLSVINPDIQPEKQILDKLLEFSLQNNAHRYLSAQGLPELRRAVADRYLTRYQVALSSDLEVCTDRGTNAALSSIFKLFSKKFNRAPKVLMPSPSYSMHLEVARLWAAEYDFYNICTEEQILAELSSKLGDNPIDILLLNFPNNPTGKFVTKDFYSKLVKLLPNNCWVVNDFVYADLCFQHQAACSLLTESFANLPLLEIYSLSKGFSLPGWRLSFVVGNRDLMRELVQYQTEVDYGCFLGFQRAAAFALKASPDFSEITKAIYQERSEMLSQQLRDLGFEVHSEPAGCCLWVRLPQDRTEDSYSFCSNLLREEQLAIQPGEVFGATWNRMLRIALTASKSELSEAIRRLESYLGKGTSLNNSLG